MLRKRKMFCVLLQLLLGMPVLISAQVLPFQTITYDECQFDSYVDYIIPGDLDGDDDLDMVTFHGDITVILNNGNNDFEMSGTFVSRGDNYKALLTDINDDGFPDLCYLHRVFNNNHFFYHLNDGEGGFEIGDTLTLDSSIVDFKIFDITGDEREDLIFRFGRSACFKENLGEGNFGETQIFASHFPEIFLDVNQDGEIDYFGLLGSRLGLFINRGELNFELADTVLSGIDYFYYGLVGHELIDLDGDNDLDIIVLNSGQISYVHCLTNEGNGNFTESSQLALKHWIRKMFLTDINNDEHSDIVLQYNYGISTFLGNGEGTFELLNNLYIYGASTVMDSDNNGFGDIVIPNCRESKLGIMVNDGTGFYNGEYFEIYPDLPPRSITNIKYLDFESDGDPDMIQISGHEDEDEDSTSWSAQLALNDGNGNFEVVDSLFFLKSDVDEFLSSRSLIFFDFTGDQRADLLLEDIEDRTRFRLFESNDSYQFVEIGSIDMENNGLCGDISAADFDSDGDLDFFASAGGNKVKLWHNSGNGEFVLADSIDAYSNFAFHFADINNDGALDFLSSTDCTSVAITLNDGEGFFSENSYQFSSENWARPYGIASGDFNRDDLIDLAVEFQFPNDIQIFYQIEDNEFEFHQSIRSTGTPHVFDIDQDGDLDVILSSEFTTILLNDGEGNFEIENTYAFGHSNPFSIADYNGDGELDLVKAGDGGIYYTYQPGEWNRVPKQNLLPSDFKMPFAYPNPFNSSFRLNYDVNTSSQVGVKVYDLRGRVLYNQDLLRGLNTVSIDGSNWATGAYFVNVEVGGEAQTLKVNCLK